MQHTRKAAPLLGLATLAALGLAALTAPAQAQTLDPANGHYYEYVDGKVSWDLANTDADSMSYDGVTGHLATITSADENTFITDHIIGTNDSWIGGYQDTSSPNYSEPGGGWTWVTGEAFSYTNWGNGEPSNSGGDENNLELYADDGHDTPGVWNDLNDANQDGLSKGYVVEYDTLAPEPSSLMAFAFTGLGALGLMLKARKRKTVA